MDNKLKFEGDMYKYYDTCPKCGESITAGGFENEGIEAWRRVECIGCGYTYDEVFVFSYNEEVV